MRRLWLAFAFMLVGVAVVVAQRVDGGVRLNGATSPTLGPTTLTANATNNKNIYLTGTIPNSAPGGPSPAALYMDTHMSGVGDSTGLLTAAGFFLIPSFTLADNLANISVATYGQATITLAGHTVTNATTLDVQGPPTNGTNKRSLWVRTGSSEFGGPLTVTGTNAITFSGATGASVGPFSTLGTQLTAADGGAYFYVTNGAVAINSAALQLKNAGTNKFSIPIVGTTDGQAQFTRGDGSIGIGVDVATDKVLKLEDRGFATGLELNLGTPSLGTCTGGSLVSGSHNFGGEITGNTSGSCILNFGTPNFTNTPFCTLNDETTLVAARVSARSASSITITGLPSGDAVQYICLGRIGT